MGHDESQRTAQHETGTRTLTGVGVGRGIAIAPAVRMPDPLPEPAAEPFTGDVDAEKSRLAAALDAVAADLNERGARAGGDAQHVLEAQALMAADPALLEDAQRRIDDGSTGERAVFDAFHQFAAMLTEMGGYMAERAADLGDVAQRVIAHLRGVPAPGVPESDESFILVARDLAPADTALLDLSLVRGLLTSEGGPTSHTAILAKSNGIPAIVGCADAAELAEGTRLVLDASLGQVIVNPSDSEVARADRRIAARAALADAPVTPGALKDGTEVPLLANLGSASEAQAAIDLGAEGVGLFRTEFLFLDAETAPSVEAQKEQYRAMLAAFEGKKVVVRMLDAGADKPLRFLNDRDEGNPALGLRGLRVLRARENILRDQLQALAEADRETNADLWVMAPMVADPEEAAYFTNIAGEYGIRMAGVMVEVPSCALMASEVLGVTGFASIGTNDLTQYTLAADRLLGSVAHFQDPWHPAVLRLVEMVGRAGRELGKPVGICGEAASDPALAVVLVGLGATSLSMTPAALADVRAELLKYTMEEARAQAERVLRASNANEARQIILQMSV